MSSFKKSWLFLVFLILHFSIFANNLPVLPEIKAKSFLVYDLQSQQILAGKNIDIPIEPASLTKLLTAYITFKNLAEKHLTLDKLLTVSMQGYKVEGSRTFLEPDKPASVEDILKGLIVQSGNDAAVTLAEAISGTEQAFAGRMNQEAQKLGMQHSHFENATGLPGAEHYTTPRDLLILCSALITNYPQYYSYYSIKEFTYNNIKQANRNLLLYRDPTVDGMKTGHTNSAGYNLIATGIENNRRLIAIVIGAESANARAVEAEKLLSWARVNFVNRKVYSANAPIANVKTYKGQIKDLPVGFLKDVYVSVPANSATDITPEIHLPSYLIAPISKGQVIGNVQLNVTGQNAQNLSVVALVDNQQGGFFRKFWDSILLFFK